MTLKNNMTSTPNDFESVLWCATMIWTGIETQLTQPHRCWISFPLLALRLAKIPMGLWMGMKFGYTDLFPGADASGRVVKYAPFCDKFLLSFTKNFSESYYFSAQ